MRMSFQSTSSSSATICASAVPTPWPISALKMWTVTSPSGVNVIWVFGSHAESAAAVRTPTSGSVNDSVRPTPATVVVLMKSRRSIRRAMSHPLGGALDRAPDTQVGRAAAQVARHGGVDVRVGRLRVLGEERRGLHDLPGLAVAALGHLLDDPRDLQWVLTLGMQPFDRRDLLAGGLGERDLTRAYGITVQVHGARPALGHAAAELRPRHSQALSKDPEQLGVAGGVHGVRLPIDQQGGHRDLHVGGWTEGML